MVVFPGFIDVHVHFRDPGVPEAETTASGLAAAERGGFAAVVTMPNTTPAIDSPAMLQYQFVAAAKAGAKTRLLASACISKGRLGRECADLETLAEAGAVFFTDDGTYVSDAKVMEAAMRRAADLNMVVSQHALAPGVTEAEAIARDLSLCRETGCRLHIQHISTAAGVELVLGAQREGLPVTAEATPHHLLLTRDDIPADTVRSIPNYSLFTIHSSLYKMAPPLATREDRAALREAVKAGAMMFATDHAPHPFAKKNVPYAEAANGIIGLETAIPITYGVMVEEEGMSVEDWAKAWWELPRTILARSIDISDLAETRIDVGELRNVDVEKFV